MMAVIAVGLFCWVLARASQVGLAPALFDVLLSPLALILIGAVVVLYWRERRQRHP